MDLGGFSAKQLLELQEQCFQELKKNHTYKLKRVKRIATGSRGEQTLLDIIYQEMRGECLRYGFGNTDIDPLAIYIAEQLLAIDEKLLEFCGMKNIFIEEISVIPGYSIPFKEISSVGPYDLHRFQNPFVRFTSKPLPENYEDVFYKLLKEHGVTCNHKL